MAAWYGMVWYGMVWSVKWTHVELVASAAALQPYGHELHSVDVGRAVCTRLRPLSLCTRGPSTSASDEPTAGTMIKAVHADTRAKTWNVVPCMIPQPWQDVSRSQ